MRLIKGEVNQGEVNDAVPCHAVPCRAAVHSADGGAAVGGAHNVCSVYVQYTAHVYSVVQWCTMMYSVVQWCTMMYSGVQWCTMMYSGVQWCTAVYSGSWGGGFRCHFWTDFWTCFEQFTLAWPTMAVRNWSRIWSISGPLLDHHCTGPGLHTRRPIQHCFTFIRYT